MLTNSSCVRRFWSIAVFICYPFKHGVCLFFCESCSLIRASFWLGLRWVFGRFLRCTEPINHGFDYISAQLLMSQLKTCLFHRFKTRVWSCTSVRWFNYKLSLFHSYGKANFKIFLASSLYSIVLMEIWNYPIQHFTHWILTLFIHHYFNLTSGLTHSGFHSARSVNCGCC